MLFTRVVAFFAAFFTFGLFAFASPVELATRQSNDAIADQLNTFKGVIDPLVAQIDANIDIVALTAIIAKINAEIDANVVVLGDLKKRDIEVRDEPQSDLAAIAADIIADIAVKLDAVVVVDPLAVSVTALVDVHLNVWLSALVKLSPGIVTLIASLLASVKIDLVAILWVNVLAILGL